MDETMIAALVGAVMGAVVGAVLGALATYTLDVRKMRAEARSRADADTRARRTQRQTIATCIIQDFRRLEFELRQLYETEQPTRAVIMRPTLFYDALRGEVRFFAPDTVQPVAEFFRRADHLYGAVDTLRRLGDGRITSTPQREYEIRSHAAFALQMLAPALAALQSEGGVIPGPLEWATVTYPQLPEVPPAVFDDTVARIAEDPRPAGPTAPPNPRHV